MIIEKAKELGQALVESKQYTNYVAARDAVDQDAFASNLLASYSETEQQISQLIMTSPSESEKINAMRADLEGIRQQIVDNEKINTLAEAQSNFNNLMAAVNQVLTSYLSPESGCGGGCSSCGGGCSGCGGGC
jgi:cell fate (sporulation/competence/biofilm development) regulator YlbF (YheA/YmcA/DUF963 family)